jgi:MinD-like ATPase involved in chromosome partitioning or flagellar assembly
MSIVAVVGDCTTTTAVAIAAGWPAEQEAFVLEADPSGGSLAAWLDVPRTPSLSTVVARSRHGEWPVIAELIQESSSGVRVLPAPVHSVEATRTLAEATNVLNTLAAIHPPITIADCGSVHPGPGLPPAVLLASVVLVVHRQAAASARAAAVRVERTAELVEVVAARDLPLVLAVIGTAPFDGSDIASFVGGEVGPVEWAPLADDPLAATVLAGRTGVSARRLSRLPLSRTARDLAALLALHLDPIGLNPVWESR